MAMSTYGAMMNKAVLPLLSPWNEDSLVHVTLQNSVVVGARETRRSAELPKLTSEHPQYVLRCIDEFMDAAGPENLGISTNGGKLFAAFRKIVSQPMRDEWDLARMGVAVSVPGFRQTLGRFIRRYIQPTDLSDQLRYLETARKPNGMSCLMLGSRLRFMNRLLSHFPGANDEPPLDLLGLKRVYFNMMEPEFKTAYLVAGRDISDASPFEDLVRFMKIQEGAKEARKKAAQRSQLQDQLTNKLQNSRRQRKRGQDVSTHARASNKKKKTSSTGDVCPFAGHEGHTWENCFGNPNGPNYRPGFRLPALRNDLQPSTNVRHSKKPKPRGFKPEVHHLDSANTESDDKDDRKPEAIDDQTPVPSSDEEETNAPSQQDATPALNNDATHDKMHWLDAFSA